MILIDHYLMLKNVLKKLFYSGCVSIFVATFLFSKSCPPTLPFFGLAAGAGYSLVLVDEENELKLNPLCFFCGCSLTRVAFPFTGFSTIFEADNGLLAVKLNPDYFLVTATGSGTTGSTFLFPPKLKLDGH